MVLDQVRGRFALAAVAVGVLAVSAAAVFIRLAEAPAIGVAFWLCALGAALLYVGIASGVALGAHFGFWISSLDHTSVAASVVLVSTQPVFVAILAYLLFGERTSPLSFAAMLAAIAGTVIIAGDDSVGSAAVLGNALAVVGAITAAVYVLIGRSARTGGVGVLPYSVVAYSAAALSQLAVAFVLDIQLRGYSGETWFWLWGITLGPQLMGHTAFDWALRYVEASVISATILAEPVFSALLAWLILAEKPGTPTILGGAVVLLGLFLLLRGRRIPVEPVA